MKIEEGDTVRIQFWPCVDDVVGIVRYIPTSPGDCWHIETSAGMVYVGIFATMRREGGEQ